MTALPWNGNGDWSLRRGRLKCRHPTSWTLAELQSRISTITTSAAAEQLTAFGRAGTYRE